MRLGMRSLLESLLLWLGLYAWAKAVSPRFTNTCHKCGGKTADKSCSFLLDDGISPKRLAFHKAECVACTLERAPHDYDGEPWAS